MEVQIDQPGHHDAPTQVEAFGLGGNCDGRRRSYRVDAIAPNDDPHVITGRPAGAVDDACAIEDEGAGGLRRYEGPAAAESAGDREANDQ